MPTPSFAEDPRSRLPLRPLGQRLLALQIGACLLAGLLAAAGMAMLLPPVSFTSELPWQLGACLAAALTLSAALTGLAYRRLVGRPLDRLTALLAAQDAGGALDDLRLPRRARFWHDEFDRLCLAINQRNRHLRHTIAIQREMEIELRQHRDSLAELVAHRTVTLERLHDFHALVIGMLTRFMNLPAGQADTAMEEALAGFCRFFRAPRCLLFTVDEAARGFRVAQAWPSLAAHNGTVEVRLASDTLEQQTRGARGARIWLSVRAGGEDSEEVLQLLDASACTIVGVEIMNRTVGLLCLAGQAHAAGGETARLLELGARVTATMLDHRQAQARLLETQQVLEQVNKELHHLSRFDPLTALANRRQFDETKAIEFARALRAQLPLAVLMLDIDHFKAYNDTYGHAQGDRCLQALGECLATLFARAGELPARLGGEEFAVLLPGANAESAMAAAERLRVAVWELGLPHSASSIAERVTVSTGVACFDSRRHADFDALLHDADSALYAAKARRNVVCLAE